MGSATAPPAGAPAARGLAAASASVALLAVLLAAAPAEDVGARGAAPAAAAGPQAGGSRSPPGIAGHHALLQLPGAAVQKDRPSPQRNHEFAMSAMMSVQWHRWAPTYEVRTDGIAGFFSSVVLFDWGILFAAVVASMCLRGYCVNGLSSRGCYGLGLLCWFMLGLVYTLCIWLRLGQESGQNWLAGYVLELVFVIENIFVFQVVVHAFHIPEHLILKVLQLVVFGQILFELVFFLGLAVTLRSLHFLPYVLGTWLIFCGVSAFLETNHAGPQTHSADSNVVVALRSFFGSHLEPDYGHKGHKDEGALLLVDEKGWRISLLGMAVCVLLLADFLLEIDVVLTKIEEFSNAYISFSSSAVAAFSLPELFFLSQGALQRFPELHYGIGAVLAIFGVQMLLSSVYVLRPWVSCLVVLGILLLSVAASSLRQCWEACRRAAPAES